MEGDGGKAWLMSGLQPLFFKTRQFAGTEREMEIVAGYLGAGDRLLRTAKSQPGDGEGLGDGTGPPAPKVATGAGANTPGTATARAERKKRQRAVKAKAKDKAAPKAATDGG